MPFIILLIVMMPVTVLLVGTSLGVAGAIPPLVVGAAPFYARLVETALREVDKGVVEASQAMGGSTLRRSSSRALLPEAMPGIIAGATVTAIALVTYTAMAGAVGAGGLGDLAIRFGYQRFQTDVMVVTVVLLLVLVQGSPDARATGWSLRSLTASPERPSMIRRTACAVPRRRPGARRLRTGGRRRRPTRTPR